MSMDTARASRYSNALCILIGGEGRPGQIAAAGDALAHGGVDLQDAEIGVRYMAYGSDPGKIRKSGRHGTPHKVGEGVCVGLELRGCEAVGEKNNDT